jgi:hypothetical protein
VNQANTKETNIDPKAIADEKRSAMPFLAVPGVFDGLTEQNMSRAKENIEKMKMASGAINDALRRQSHRVLRRQYQLRL